MFFKKFTVLLTIALMLSSVLNLHAKPHIIPAKPKQDFSGEYIPFQMPELLTYEELGELGLVETIKPELKAKLDRVLTVPFISNEAYYNGTKPIRPNLPGLGPSLRVVMWNIERGLRFEDIKALFTNKEEFLKRIDRSKVKPESREYKEVLEQVDLLQSADVLVLNEVDWGMKRTDYREVVKELGDALKMNWAYGVEFVEIDPINLGIEEFEEARPEDRDQLHEQISINENSFKGLHGTAILSRYPIKQATLQPLRVQGYDWYNNEKKRVSIIEKGKRKANEAIFLEKIQREIRRGGRTLLTATLEVPDLPEGELTVVAPHLENHCRPEKRQEQMKEILSYLRDIKNPVVMAGDLNTSLTDTTPTSFKREFTKRMGSHSFWVKQGINYATGVGFAFNILASGINFVKNSQDPTVRHIPIIAPNHEEALFNDLEEFRFADGNAFDFRGNSKRAYKGFGSTLANSNERATKGFAYTYELERTYGPVGKLKLDWIFVKPYINKPRDKRASYRFAPHFGRTLEEVNYSVDDRISDHNPISVDLPFNEPEPQE